MNLEIENILSVIKYIASCDLLYLFENGKKSFPLGYRLNQTENIFFDELNLLDSFSNESIKKLSSYDKLLTKHPEFTFKIFSKNSSSKPWLILLYFNKTKQQKAATENIERLFKVILKLYRNSKKYNSNDLNNELLDLINSISSVLYSINFDGSGYNFISKSVIKIFGITPEFIYKNKYALLRKIHPDDFYKFKFFVKNLKNGESGSVEYRYLKTNNKYGYVKHTGNPVFADGKIIRVVGLISEITAEKNLMAKLNATNEQLNLLMETANGLIFTLDKSGYFLSINYKGANKLGYEKSEIIGRHFLEFVSNESKSNIAISFQKILSRNMPVTFETVLISSFGQKLTFQIDAVSLKIDGKISGMLGTGSDVSVLKKDETLFKQLNAKLTEANRIISIERNRAKEKISVLEELNRLKNDFISNVSHELRTPMASIVGFAETIATDSELPRETILEFNNIILTEGKRLAKLVNDILDFSRLEAASDNLKTTKIDLIKFLKELILLFNKLAENKGIILSSEIPESEIFIEADRERLSKAIGNIISNAIKFTNSGGRVSIIAQEFLKEVEILIIDTGTGISSENISKLFQKFSKIDNLKEQQPGAGFGLAAAKQIIELHNGIIMVKSELGKGSTFIIKLPKQN